MHERSAHELNTSTPVLVAFGSTPPTSPTRNIKKPSPSKPMGVVYFLFFIVVLFFLAAKPSTPQ
jgi:hypothetical protein